MHTTDKQIISFSERPKNESQVFYRIPFLFLIMQDERVHDALKAVMPVIEGIKGMVLTGKDDKRTVFMSPEGLQINIETDYSDLWIKIGSERVTDSIAAEKKMLDLDALMIALPRKVYKYTLKEHGLFACLAKNNVWDDDLSGFIGLDAGSISINTAVVDETGTVLDVDYTNTEGDVLNNVKKSIDRVRKKLPDNLRIKGSGVTGSGHEISGAVLNADVYETELDAHAMAALHMVPDVSVIFDIGGQDSKVMYIEDGMLDDTGMNRKCGAGTGSFLNAQATRLGIPIEQFGQTSLRATKPYRFSSMCTVFVSRDLIAEQAKGNTKENIIAGLHRSLAMNFYSTLGINKKMIKPPIIFQGGVASNVGVKRALEECLFEARGERVELIVPMFSNVMGAIGMALFARNEVIGETKFRGFRDIARIRTEFKECAARELIDCQVDNRCDIVELFVDNCPCETLYACKDYPKNGHVITAAPETGCESHRVSMGG
jgi:predicted CoA-substrate-specific enzyme activase